MSAIMQFWHWALESALLQPNGGPGQIQDSWLHGKPHSLFLASKPARETQRPFGFHRAQPCRAYIGEPWKQWRFPLFKLEIRSNHCTAQPGGPPDKIHPFLLRGTNYIRTRPLLRGKGNRPSDSSPSVAIWFSGEKRKHIVNPSGRARASHPLGLPKVYMPASQRSRALADRLTTPTPCNGEPRPRGTSSSATRWAPCRCVRFVQNQMLPVPWPMLSSNYPVNTLCHSAIHNSTHPHSTMQPLYGTTNGISFIIISTQF
ncbi:uncharacterized protein B0I36DRAFT_23561 [Microdochium trichocladiopsis]|uniref:Uncharacterized protein n=1 Tax=Microdochium trichocladiopsis TaxID=1682393 RepID=A0A9P8YJB0_9PEZI|nr:uncharacterized protein B0I36DRAFT_23561 [Microdochium trichocladiopsis]KAH7041449.1 hypothetical protein B0I36DRAFT_23561 [Microdochium trichocladiopsis]